MGILQCLAEGDPTAIAAQGLSTLERLIQGGPALILGVLVLVLGFVLYKLWHYIHALESDFRKTSNDLLREQIAQTQQLATLLTQSQTIHTRNEDVMRDVVDLIKSMKGALDHTATLGDLLTRSNLALAKSEELCRDLLQALRARKLKDD